MKKILSLLMILMLASSTAMAAEKRSSKSKKKEAAKKEEKKAEKKQSSSMGSEKRGWVVQIQGDVNFIASNTTANTNNVPATFTGAGIGFEVSTAYAFNKNFSLGLLTGYHATDMTSASAATLGGVKAANWSYAPIEVVAQYNFGGSTSPYLLLGLGIATSALNLLPTTPNTPAESINDTNIIFSPGVGVAFELSENANFFLQTRLDIVAASTNFKNFLWNDQGVFIPIQAGVNFSGI